MTKDKIEIGFPTKAGYIGVKIPKEVAILGMKISTGWLIAFVVFIIVVIGASWYMQTSIEKARSQA